MRDAVGLRRVTLDARRPRASRTARRSSRSSPACRPGFGSIATRSTRTCARGAQGYGRSPRQQLEADEVEVLAGLRHGLTLGTPLALVIREPRPRELGVGDEPVAARGRAEREGDEAGHAAAPGSRRPGGALKFGHDDVRNALERASARQTAVHVAAGAVAKALLAEIGIDGRGRVVEIGGDDTEAGWQAATDAARADRDTLGGVVEVVADGAPPGLGSYAEKADRLDARLAAALMGIQAVKGVEIGDGFALARMRGSEAHDEIEPDRRRATNRAGGIEAGVTNGEPVVVRAAMKPLADADAPAPLGRPRDAASRARRSSSEATSRRSRRSRSSPRPRSRGSSRAPRARSSAATRSSTSSQRTPPTSSGSRGATP